MSWPTTPKSHLPFSKRVRVLALVAVAALAAVGVAVAATSKAAVAPSNNSQPSISAVTSTSPPNRWNSE